jgi:hypothetical protein
MPYQIPPFPEISVVGGGAGFPGNLSTEDAPALEIIHKELRASASNFPDRLPQLVCIAVQQCYDMLKGIYARRDSMNTYVLEVVLPEKAFRIALECQWLPVRARADSPEWQGWIKQLLAGRFSRVGLEDSSIPDPYLFVPFPVPADSGKDAAGQLTVGEPKSILSESGAGEMATTGEAVARAAFVKPLLAEKGWSPLDWANAASVDFHTVNDYLKGTTKPYSSTRKKLADSLGVHVQDMPT